ncbi:coiled-coil domain-containing protein 167 isoform X3 [Poecile atricapillus]|uniref:coiled-coil domain-containing protein 167 isoform X3 n=1 Tax=Poecile atricapillus TaxID=48891 RepID=UPI002738CA04|nr:coiled-coil domain-containing protein 167 isoform X3 [Poecile atricapillus]
MWSYIPVCIQSYWDNFLECLLRSFRRAAVCAQICSLDVKHVSLPLFNWNYLKMLLMPFKERRAKRRNGSSMQLRRYCAEISTEEIRQCEVQGWFSKAGLALCFPVGFQRAQIDGLEEKLARCRQSMEEADLKLRREKLSPEGRKSLERERNLLMTKADDYELS